MVTPNGFSTDNRARNQLARRAKASLFAVTIAMALSGSAGAQSHDELRIDGKLVKVEERSIKCDGKPGDFPDYINMDRLANCGSARIVTFPSGSGREELIQFTIKPGDKEILGGTRAELADTRITRNGGVAWYRFSTLIPTDFPIESPHRLVLAQWHELDLPNKPYHRPPISHRLWNREFAVELFNKQIIAEKGGEHDGRILYSAPELERGVLHDYVYKVVWTPDEQGEIRAWHRTCDVLEPEKCTAEWTEFITYTGSTGYDSDAVEGYYFKFGLYTTTGKFETAYTAYHAGYQSGKTAGDIGLTDPMFK